MRSPSNGIPVRYSMAIIPTFTFSEVRLTGGLRDNPNLIR